MKLVKLSCPTCAGALELPDNLTVAHCIYCGNKILLDQDSIAQETRELERYIELCTVAVDAKNNNEVIRYCNLILEIDPNNIDAWINKAVSTFWLTTGANDRYEEAMEYLNKAARISPNDRRIETTRIELTRQEATWLNRLGIKQCEAANAIYGLNVSDSRARESTKDSIIKGMNYYLRASDLAPDDTVILGNIDDLYRKAYWISWSDKVKSKVSLLPTLRAKQLAVERLPILRAELNKANSNLAYLRNQKGLLIGTRTKGAEKRINHLSEQISILEQWVAYDPIKK